ncbi:MAG TPA: hypothetical protein PLE97_02710, partial [Tenuifilaceae bacterium]|nr:hypothetical protein [Tenuifilaceae bacterium]
MDSRFRNLLDYRRNLFAYWQIPDSKFKIQDSRTCPPNGGFQISELARLPAELVRLLTELVR